MSIYQPGIPTGTVNFDVDYQNIQDNFQQLDTSFGVNHVPFSINTVDDPAGYHTEVNFVPFSTTVTNPPNNVPVIAPTPTNGFGQLFSAQQNDGFSTDEALFYLSGGGKLTQLTRNLSPSVSTNGYTDIPGGLVIQWGRVTGLSGSWPTTPQVLNFNVSNINFAFNCFGVWTTFIGPTSSSTGDITINSLSTSSFTWQFSGSSGASFDGFYWVALGN